MVAKSVLSADELSFQRLLEKTKKLSRVDISANVWKVQAASTYLENLFSKLQNDSSLDQDLLIQYGREVHQMKLLVEAEHQKDVVGKLRVLEKIPKNFPEIPEINVHDSFKDEVNMIHESSAGVRARNREFYKADLRRELLGETKKTKEKDGSLTEVLTQHEDIQENLANELLGLTKNLKQNLTLAGNVIKDDNKRLTSMQSQVDVNRERLGLESTRLAHHAYKCGFDCMLIFVALFIFWSFIVMVIIMKVFPKRAIS